MTHEVNGWLVDFGDPGAIADTVKQLCANAGLRATLSTMARKHMTETFNLSAMLGEYEKVYAKLT